MAWEWCYALYLGTMISLGNYFEFEVCRWVWFMVFLSKYPMLKNHIHNHTRNYSPWPYRVPHY